MTIVPCSILQETLEQLALEEIDQSNAVLFIHYDPDTKMIYLAGKVSFIIGGGGGGTHIRGDEVTRGNIILLGVKICGLVSLRVFE